jgi:hypothetical protein
MASNGTLCIKKGGSMKFKDELKKLEKDFEERSGDIDRLSESDKAKFMFYSAYTVLYDDEGIGHKRAGLSQDDMLRSLSFIGYAADQGYVLAQYGLANILLDTGNIEKQAEAFTWFQRAAAQGLEEAKYVLGETPSQQTEIESSAERKTVETEKSSGAKDSVQVGSIMRFADIEWRVLDVRNNKALLISEKTLETRPYNDKYVDVTWETCAIRQYLNGEFYDKLGAEKSAIAETRNNNPSNPWYGTAGGNATTDKVFLLSLDEVVKYFGDSGALANRRRKDWEGSAKSDGACVFDQYNNARIAKNNSGETSWWWLRSPGCRGYNAASIDSCHGYIHVLGDSVSGTNGVRPALWLKL